MFTKKENYTNYREKETYVKKMINKDKTEGWEDRCKFVDQHIEGAWNVNKSLRLNREEKSRFNT